MEVKLKGEPNNRMNKLTRLDTSGCTIEQWKLVSEEWDLLTCCIPRFQSCKATETKVYKPASYFEFRCFYPKLALETQVTPKSP